MCDVVIRAGDVEQVRLSGVLSKRSAERVRNIITECGLRQAAVLDFRGAALLLTEIDWCALAAAPLIARPIPAAILCTTGQRVQLLQHSERLARGGHLRIVFCEHAEALGWALQQQGRALALAASNPFRLSPAGNPLLRTSRAAKPMCANSDQKKSNGHQIGALRALPQPA